VPNWVLETDHFKLLEKDGLAFRGLTSFTKSNQGVQHDNNHQSRRNNKVEWPRLLGTVY
jgi:hypothetical protein